MYGYSRYADDFIITARNEEDIEAVVPIVEEWLSKRGLTLNKEKISITQIAQGDEPHQEKTDGIKAQNTTKSLKTRNGNAQCAAKICSTEKNYTPIT